MSSRIGIAVISDAQFAEETDAFFLRCVENHPNLYDENHEYYNEEIMQKTAWGLIAEENALTGKIQVQFTVVHVL